ncbi:hypothetical protein OS493_020840 [Desmophyllum pertusum]|uniref:Uncharacterized protein n=1 Tax=Desmophyllum pertusum TaxID=174260 RepID=A0A9X0CEF1_9CNID|nr:hypothetical protein OS493_020840 [Desmophyllum pertusum]
MVFGASVLLFASLGVEAWALAVDRIVTIMYAQKLTFPFLIMNLLWLFVDDVPVPTCPRLANVTKGVRGHQFQTSPTKTSV